MRPTTRQEALRYGWLVRCAKGRVINLTAATGHATICGGCADKGIIRAMNIIYPDGHSRWVGLCETCVVSLLALIPKLPLPHEIYDQLIQNNALCQMSSSVVWCSNDDTKVDCVWCNPGSGVNLTVHLSCSREIEAMIVVSYKAHRREFLWPRFIGCYASGLLPRELVYEICILLWRLFDTIVDNRYWLAIEPVYI